ncbi:hypothetical protein QE372_002602 [Agrobacterium pusense]|uniref:hypothetical protein n=1 Tax=Agrobacterium pusense TaxID=648995 RepID=UPI0028611275|nr:hypothetical protein [Agrobacterium pusense]MDR6190334.1 hypothetical protein [Agrobacterium pusense]
MRMAFPRPLALVPVCSEARLRLAAFPAGKAERLEKAEGKIKKTGTMRRRFRGKPLSAHSFGAALAAPWFWTSRAAILRKAFGLLGFERHHGSKSAVSRGFAPEALV